VPANLSPEFKKAEERFRAAVTPEEKLVGLEEMLQTIPKHKGTEKMQADLKTRIKEQKHAMSAPGGKHGGRHGDWQHVEKQGAGQVILLGAPNCGKSALVRELTGLPAEVAAYPFTTTVPAAGMMVFEDVQIQLVDTPPVAPESPPWLFHIFRTCDLLLWLLDLSDDALLDAFEQTRGLLATNRIDCRLVGSDSRLTVPAPVRPEPDKDVDNLQSSIDNGRKTLLLGAKCDDAGAQDRLAILRELIGDLPVLLVSTEHHVGLEEMKRRAFESLRILRVYTKKPGKPATMDDPVILPIGATVIDAANHLHKDFAQSLQYARLWNNSGVDGLRVERAHVLQDHDVIEFHV
jgi:ribosome-interacting GTPase 1